MATVSVSGNTVTVTGVAYGTATITVKVAAGTNHNAPADKTCTVKVNVFSTTLNSNTWAAIKAASEEEEGTHQLFLLPSVIFNDNGVTLDDMTVQDIENAAGAPVSVVSCNPLDYLPEIIKLAQDES